MTFGKDIKRLVNNGALTLAQNSQYSTTVFRIPKKTGNVIFITDFYMLNQKLVRNPYPLPRIGKDLQKREALIWILWELVWVKLLVTKWLSNHDPYYIMYPIIYTITRVTQSWGQYTHKYTFHNISNIMYDHYQR